VEKCGLDAFDSGLGPVVGSFEYGYEPSCSTKGGEYLDCVIICFSKRIPLHEVS